MRNTLGSRLSTINSTPVCLHRGWLQTFFFALLVALVPPPRLLEGQRILRDQGFISPYIHEANRLMFLDFMFWVYFPAFAVTTLILLMLIVTVRFVEDRAVGTPRIPTRSPASSVRLRSTWLRQIMPSSIKRRFVSLTQRSLDLIAQTTYKRIAAADPSMTGMTVIRVPRPQYRTLSFPSLRVLTWNLMMSCLVAAVLEAISPTRFLNR